MSNSMGREYERTLFWGWYHNFLGASIKLDKAEVEGQSGYESWQPQILLFFNFALRFGPTLSILFNTVPKSINVVLSVQSKSHYCCFNSFLNHHAYADAAAHMAQILLHFLIQ